MLVRWLLTTMLSSATATSAQPYLLVLGVPHFANHHRDIVNANVEDVLTPARQREIERLVTALAATRPNHVAVEWSTTNKLPSTSATPPIALADTSSVPTR